MLGGLGNIEIPLGIGPLQFYALAGVGALNLKSDATLHPHRDFAERLAGDVGHHGTVGGIANRQYKIRLLVRWTL